MPTNADESFSPILPANMERTRTSAQRAADLRAKITAETSMSASPASATGATSPLNGPPGGYNLARGTSYGTLPRSDLFTIPEVAEPATKPATKLTAALNEKRAADLEANLDAGDLPELKWSPFTKVWVLLMCAAWAYLMLFMIFGRVNVALKSERVAHISKHVAVVFGKVREGVVE